MKNYFLLLIMLSVTALLVINCKPEPAPNPEPENPGSTWEIIQQRIFEPNCVSCHTAGTSFARQSDLVLTKAEAYSQLIDREPANMVARNDGLMLLGNKKLESLHKSFLWEKINAPDQEHFYSDHPGYGEIMPYGSPPLTNGELEFIRQWIVKGAPETGFVADEELLKDSSRFELPQGEFVALQPPAQGIQLHLGPFDIIPNYEREIFYYQPLDNPQPIYINRVEISMRPGSHHFILYDFLEGTSTPRSEVYRDLRNENGDYKLVTVTSIQDQVYLYGTQIRETDYQFPEGVALRLPAGKSLDMNTHYVNRTSETMQGEVYSNLHTVDSSEVQHIAHNIFLNNDDFSLPPGKTTTLSKTYTFDERRHVFLLSSHAHEHNTEFRIYLSGGARNGELVYFSRDWEHPPLIEFDPPLVLEAGTGLRAEATYNNWTSQTLNFGLLSQDEMMIIFGAYYLD